MKKLILAVLSAVLTITIAVSGTVAYYTDAEEAINVMTSGRVNVDLVEQQRSQDGMYLEAFDSQSGKKLSPLVGSVEEKDAFGLPVAENFVDKIISVRNTMHSSPAWVRVLVAFPAGMDADPSSSAALHMLLGHGVANTYDADWNVLKTGEVQLPDGAYSLYTFSYRHVLSAGDTTATPCVTGFYMDPRVDKDTDTNQYFLTLENGDVLPVTGVAGDGSLRIPVMVQAAQAAGFDTYAQAFMASGFDDENGVVVQTFVDAVR